MAKSAAPGPKAPSPTPGEPSVVRLGASVPTTRRSRMAQASAASPLGETPEQVQKRKVLAKLNKVRPMSATAQRVLALTSDADADVGRIADAISGDPALATETLRIANSAVYRRAYPIDDLRRAVTTIGLQQIHAMATAMALLSTVSSNHPLFGELHKTSVLAGTFAGLLTTELYEVEKSTAFVAGLLSEIGAMACLMVDPDYANFYQAGSSDPLLRAELEQATYGITTFEVGAKLLEKNQLPEAVVRAVGEPPDLRERADATLLTRITGFSRNAAPIVVAAARHDSLTEAGPRLVELAKLAGLDFSADKLVGLFDWATSSASFMIGG